MLNYKFRHIPVLLALIFTANTFAVTISEDFTQATANTNDWQNLGYACLTAGTAVNNTALTSKIKGCNLVTPDAVGSGALRLTPASTIQAGAITSNFTFPSTQGLQVTFTTYTWGGSGNGGGSNQGADGISFFLQDGSVGTTLPNGTSNIGAYGGSLGYACAQSKGGGLTGAYLGLGMDEWGNFLNSGDNTATGILNTNSTLGASTINGTNTFSSSPDAAAGGSTGRYYQPNRIGLRGAGNVSWYWLNANYPSLYPSSLSTTEQTNAVKSTCATGTLWSAVAPKSITGIAWASTSGGKLTFTVNGHGYVNGNTVTIGGTITPASILGTYTITSIATTNTFTVALATNPGTITNTAGTSTSTASTAAAMTNLGAASNSGGPVLMDYPVIPGGFWVLPDSQKIANSTTPATSRAAATPITYKLSITPGGLLTYMYSYNGGAYQSVLTNWPITTGNGPLPATFRFGFAGSTGGATNNHDITCFLAEPTQSSSSASANTVQSGQVRTGTQIYLASYNSNSWSGSLVSNALVNTAGVISVATNADWDANCVLTGGGCMSMGSSGGVATTNISVLPPASRKLLTWNGSAGVGLTWANLTSAQQAVLNSSDTAGSNRTDWLRGVRSQEQTATPAGLLRARAGVLGDIVNSSPTWVGPPSLNYPSPFEDKLYGISNSTLAENGGSAQKYSGVTSSFSTTLATRMNVVYVGSNDGFLHGFRAGSFAADGITYVATNNDGREVVGYMPSTVLGNSNAVNLTSPLYGHNYFVDATPGTGDLFYNDLWHSWLVGGLGAGGKEIYILDITDPTGLVTSGSAFSESNAASLVKGSWTSATLTCTTVGGTAVTSCGDNLGYTYGTPLIRRLHNGKWAIIFGNGFGSTNYHAGVFIGLVDSTTGAVSFKWLDTGVGTSATPNGIAYMSSADLDGDRVTDYLYAGDLLGNVWRFDLTSTNIADWEVSKFGQPAATPLFTAKIGTVVQPITTKIAVTATTTGGSQRVILGFGTGSITPFTTAAAATYATGTQTVYGIWDWDMANWNAGRTTANAVTIPSSVATYASLAQVTTSPYRTFARANLYQNTFVTQTSTRRTLATSTVCWNGSAACGSGNNQYGWYLDLPDTNEQIIYSPIFSAGDLFVNTTIPPVTTITQCTPQLPSGWTLGLDMASGGGSPQNIFPDSSDSFVVTSGNSSIVGIKQNSVGTPYIVSVGSQQYIVNTDVTGGAADITKFNPQGGVTVKRMTWEQIR